MTDARERGYTDTRRCAYCYSPYTNERLRWHLAAVDAYTKKGNVPQYQHLSRWEHAQEPVAMRVYQDGTAEIVEEETS